MSMFESSACRSIQQYWGIILNINKVLHSKKGQFDKAKA